MLPYFASFKSEQQQQQQQQQQENAFCRQARPSTDSAYAASTHQLNPSVPVSKQTLI